MTGGPTQTLPLLDFDRDLTLEELLSGIDTTMLIEAISSLVGAPVRLVAATGQPVPGSSDEPLWHRLPIRHEIDVVGHLESDIDAGAAGRAAVTLVEMLVKASARYLMASSLHLQAVKSDYDELMSKHEALLASEARFRNLTKNLEQRVTEQVATIEETHRKLYQAEKMASIGQLAAGVAHEINNPLGFISSNLKTSTTYLAAIESFLEAWREGAETPRLEQIWKRQDLGYVLEDFRTLLQESADGAGRVAAIVKDLKGFSNVDEGVQRQADVNKCLRSACKVAADLLSHAEVDLALEPLPAIECQPGYLGQAFMNILQNAALATPKGGKIQVSSRQEHDQIYLVIRDHGCGIPEAEQAKIFDPFFTTREVGAGSGLGLTLCRDIIRAHGGEITIDSKVGEGTTVTLCLPLRTPFAAANDRAAVGGNVSMVENRAEGG